MPSALSRRLVALVVAVTALLGCSSNEGGLPPPSSTSSTSTTSTTVPDYSTVVLAEVDGTTTTTLAAEGSSTVRGTVTAEDGPVEAATVRLERLVLGAVQRTDVTTGPDGRFELAEVPGGAYRVRAFLPPDHAQLEPEVFLLRRGEARDLELRLQRFGNVEVLPSVAPPTPQLDEPVNLALRVVERSVDADGVVGAAPVVGARVALASGRWSAAVDGGDQGITGADGQVVLQLRCDAAGPPGITVTVAVPGGSGGGEDGDDESAGSGTGDEPGSGELFDLDLPACVAPSTTTTTSAADGDDTTTSTTSG